LHFPPRLLGAVPYPQVRNEIVGNTANWNEPEGRMLRVNGGRAWPSQEALAQSRVRDATSEGKGRDAGCIHAAGRVSLRRYLRFQRNCLLLSQRDYALQPKVGLPRQRLAYLGLFAPVRINPNGVAPKSPMIGATPSALKMPFDLCSQGRSCLPTLGFGAESRWDNGNSEFQLVGNAQLRGGACPELADGVRGGSPWQLFTGSRSLIGRPTPVISRASSTRCVSRAA
jgi:hypothetical protein